MDEQHLDQVARRLGATGTRRTAFGALLAGLLLPLEATARGRDKHRTRHGNRSRRSRVQTEACWRAGACIVSKGSNVSQCDLAGYVAPESLDCTRCNFSRANLRGADLTDVDLTRANLNASCLVDANLSGATVTNSTNLYNAIFCRTIMPDGSTNNSGCGSGTPCCPTCSGASFCPSGCCIGNPGTCGVCPGTETCGGGGTPGVCGEEEA